MKIKKRLAIVLMIVCAVFGVMLLGAVAHPVSAAETSGPSETTEPTDLPESPDPSTITKGDVNGDGNVNGEDATLLGQYLAKQIPLSEWQIIAGDVVGGDNEITIDDVIRICQYVVHLDVQFEWDCEHTECTEVVTEPTCFEGGYTTYTCTNCGYSYKGNEVKALGHDYVNHYGKAATCTKPGWKAYQTCNRCDYTSREDVEALGHEYVDHEAQAPSCTEVGWNAYQTCTRCNYSSREEIPAKGHTFGPWTDSRKNCTVAGKRVRTCSVCNTTEEQTLAAGDHSWDDGQVTVDASCTEKGTMTYTCEICKTTQTEEIAALGHSWDDGQVTVEASCLEAGTITYSCEKCNATKVKRVAVLGHDYVVNEELSVYSECEGGKIISLCSRCDDKKTELLDGNGHNYVNGICTVCEDPEPDNLFTVNLDKTGKVEAGQTVTATITLGGDVIKTAGYRLKLTYDTGRLTYVSGKEGDCAYTLYESNGVVTIVQFAAQNATTGGTVATLTFKTKASGNAVLKLKVLEIDEVWINNSIHDTSYNIDDTAATIAIGHDYVLDEEKSTYSACEGGVKVWKCSTCDSTYSETFESTPGAEHVYGENGVCTKCGIKKPINRFTVSTNATGQVSVGQTVKVTITLDDVVKTAGYTLKLNYDVEKLTYVSGEKGSKDVLAFNNKDGVVTVVVANGNNNVTGGTVITITFEAKAAGEAALTLSVSGMTEVWEDNTIHETSYDVINGKITIGEQTEA